MSARSHNGFTLVELLVVITIIGVLIALVVPAVIGSTARARRAKCINYQRELGLAVTGYTARKGRYPGCRERVGNNLWVSWVVAIFPDLGRKKLWEEFREGQGIPTGVDQLVCPGDEGGEENSPVLSYVANTKIFLDPSDPFYPRMPSQVPSTTNTVMLGENYQDGGSARMWTQTDATQVGFRLPNPLQDRLVGQLFPSSHPAGSVVTFCDGSAKFMPDTTIINLDGTIQPEQEL